MSLRNWGVDLRAQTVGSGRINGFRLQWRPDEAGTLRGTIVRVEHNAETIRFFVNDDRDAVQGCQRRGQFYEEEELEIIKDAFPGGTFVDIGANVGNHTVFAGRVLKALKVIAFEPGDLAYEILLVNISLNGLQGLAEIHKCGLADVAQRARVSGLYNSNLGGNRIIPDVFGSVDLRRGDDMLINVKVDFIKLDVEASEISVLYGLRQTISRDRPIMFIEVDNENLEEFQAFCVEQSYNIEKEYRRYSTGINFLIRPN